MAEPRIRNKEIRRVRVADLDEAPWNHRLHPKKQQDAFDGVVDEIGFYGYPEVFVADNGRLMLVDGHLRKERLLAKYGPDAEIEVNVTDFTEAEAKKATATKDALAGLAGFDPQKIDLLLPQATFDSTAVNQMLAGMAKQAGAEFGKPAAIVEDEVPDVPKDVITKPGDLWLLGDVHFVCESCGKRYEYDEGLLMGGECPCG